MKFLSTIFDFMFAPAGTFETDITQQSTSDDCNDGIDSNASQTHYLTVNPATGLPMIEDSGIDVMGSPYGFDSHHIEPFISDTPTFTHDCASVFDNDIHSFDCSSTFDCCSSFDCFSSDAYGSTFD